MLAHWEEVEPRHVERGHIRASWAHLGEAAGSEGVGLRRIRIEPEAWSTPAHVHGFDEEIFYVLGGSGLSWQDGKTFEIGGGDCLVHLPEREAHTLYAGPDGLDVLAFGQRGLDAATLLPRAGVFWLGARWVNAGDAERHPFRREQEVGPPERPEPSPRPSSIVNAADVEPDARAGATVASSRRDLGRAAGSRRTGLALVEVTPGKLNAPPHCHSAEEELFVVLEGSGTLELSPGPRASDWGVEAETYPVLAGHVVSRPPGTGVAHAFRAGDGGLTLLAYGTREPNDVCYYPRSNKVSLRGVGLIGRLEHVDYWDGED